MGSIDSLRTSSSPTRIPYREQLTSTIPARGVGVDKLALSSPPGRAYHVITITPPPPPPPSQAGLRDARRAHRSARELSGSARVAHWFNGILRWSPRADKLVLEWSLLAGYRSRWRGRERVLMSLVNLRNSHVPC